MHVFNSREFKVSIVCPCEVCVCVCVCVCVRVCEGVCSPLFCVDPPQEALMVSTVCVCVASRSHKLEFP